LQKINATPDAEVKRNSIPIARFLAQEILSNFSRERLRKIKNFDPNAADYYERMLPALAEDDFSRGVTEMEVNIQEAGIGNQPT